MFLVMVKLRTLDKVAVVVKRGGNGSSLPSAKPVFNLSLMKQLFYLSLLFSESSFMGVQTPEYMALIGQPIEMLDQWSQSAIIGGR